MSLWRRVICRYSATRCLSKTGATPSLSSCNYYFSSSSSSVSLSLWRGKKKKAMSREGLLVVQELKRLKANDDNARLSRCMQTRVARLLKTDLLAVLAEFQRQNDVDLALKILLTVRNEIWYKPDKFLYKDMLITLARNSKGEEAMKIWNELKKEKIHLDQHMYGDIIRAFLDNALPSEAFKLYQEMKESPDSPLELPYRVILKGLLPYPSLREEVKQDFEELFPDIEIKQDFEELFPDIEIKDPPDFYE